MIRSMVIAGLAAGSIATGPATASDGASTHPPQPLIGHHAKGVISLDGLRFHDLDGDGRLTPYEDWRLAPEVRAADLLQRLTLAEKAGLMMHGTPPSIDGTLRGAWNMARIKNLIERNGIRFFIHRLSGAPADLARTANSAQELAEASRLGIPIVFSSDPRNQVVSTFGMSVDAGEFSLWPDPTGMGAIGDPALVRQFAHTVAREYRSVGITMALAPMADLATEPRWSRINGTFGDDPVAVGRMTAAYVEGLHGGRSGVLPTGVASVVKHWVGYGAQPGGFDAHNPYGRHLSFPSGSIARHVAPFQAAFAVNAAGVMPTYGIISANVSIAGKPAEPVGAGFNKALLTTLLRGRLGFGGIVLSDWKITDDCPRQCEEGTLDIEAIGMPWGVEHLTKSARFAKAIDAGVDQFGGVMETEIVADLVRSGTVSGARLDISVSRLLVLMFRLGLFENAYVDPAAADAVVGDPAARALGLAAQRRSLTLLVNRNNKLPLISGSGRKVWLFNIHRSAAVAAGLDPVDRPEDADLSILRIATPFTQHKSYFFGARHHEGMPEFLADNADLAAIDRAARAGKPVIVSVYLDRPAILTPLLPKVTALLGNYGVEDAALLDVVMGRGRPQGRLPFELPRSAGAIERQKPDVPSDSARPLFRRGFGLRYRHR